MLPPDPSDSGDYELWRKDVQVWAMLTDTIKIKQGRALQYAVRGNEKLREAVLHLDDHLVDCDNGLENVLLVIDDILRKSDHQLAIEAYENFTNLKKEPSQNLQQYLLDFELAINALKRTGSTLSESVVFYKLLKSLGLTDYQEKIIKATVSEFTYSAMKPVLRRMFSL